MRREVPGRLPNERGDSLSSDEGGRRRVDIASLIRLAALSNLHLKRGCSKANWIQG